MTPIFSSLKEDKWLGTETTHLNRKMCNPVMTSEEREERIHWDFPVGALMSVTMDCWNLRVL